MNIIKINMFDHYYCLSIGNKPQTVGLAWSDLSDDLVYEAVHTVS